MTVKTLELSEATAPLADYVRLADSETTVIMEDGLPVAAVVSLANTDMETILLCQNPQFIEIIEAGRASLKTEGALSPDEVRQRLGLPLQQTP
jgi:hypothetical protein